jgi:hypothetical protein
LAEGSRLEVTAASSKRAATDSGVQTAFGAVGRSEGHSVLFMTTSLPIESLADAPHQFALEIVQPLVLGVDHQDALVTPAAFLHRIQVCHFGLQATQGALVGWVGIFTSHLLCIDCPVQDGQGIGFVVVGDEVTKGTHG